MGRDLQEQSIVGIGLIQASNGYEADKIHIVCEIGTTMVCIAFKTSVAACHLCKSKAITVRCLIIAKPLHPPLR